MTTDANELRSNKPSQNKTDVARAFDNSKDERYWIVETFTGRKSGSIACDNVLDYFICKKLDASSQVVSFSRSRKQFAYYDPSELNEKVADVNFEGAFGDGRKFLVLAVSQHDIRRPSVASTIEMFESYADELSAMPLVLTELEIFGTPAYMESVIQYFLIDKNFGDMPQREA